MSFHRLPSRSCPVLLMMAAVAAAPAMAADDTSAVQSTSVYSGIDFAKDAEGYFSGATLAFNGDLSKSGVVFKVDGGISNYEYASDLSPTGIIDGDGYQVSAMLGYLWALDSVSLTLAAGVDYQDQELSPDDPTATVRGSETGLRVAADFWTGNDKVSFSGSGSYSTAFDSYWTRARAGLILGRFTIGPEALAFGSEGYDAQRLGGYGTYAFKLTPSIPAEIDIAVGHQFVSDESNGGVQSQGGGEGTYVTLSTSFSF